MEHAKRGEGEGACLALGVMRVNCDYEGSRREQEALIVFE